MGRLCKKRSCKRLLCKRQLWKDRNEGASLLAVLVALVVVGVIAIAITDLTVANIQMREVEKQSKQSFYSAESVMDEVSAELNRQTAEVMREAYEQVLTEYSDYLNSGADPQDKFEQLYVDKLVDLFQIAMDPAQEGNRTSVLRGTYDVTKVASMLSATKTMDAQNKLTLNDVAADGCERYFKGADAGKARFEANYVDGLFSLKGIKVGYVENGYETTVSADLVFHAPELHYKGYKNVGNFMLYSLIAQYGIEVDTSDVQVYGNAYAGVNGIRLGRNAGDNCKNIVFDADRIITRGSIYTHADEAELVLGNSTGQIWAENIETVGKKSRITLSGSTYVSDDLTLSGDGSAVYVSGNYFGFNFQENYAAKDMAKDAKNSSAIMVNGRDCTLDLSGIASAGAADADYGRLWVAGRSYISRGDAALANTDIMLGDSIAARTSQLACYVPDQYLDMSVTPAVQFTAAGRTDYSKNLNVADVATYLDPVKAVVPYWYKSNGIAKCRYYLNFKNEQAANDFYEAYYTRNASGAYASASNYLSTLNLGSGILYSLSGDFLYESLDEAGKMKTKIIAPDNTDYQKGDPVWNFAERMAKKYKTLQTTLDETGMGVASDAVRVVNKESEDTVFNNLVDRQVLGDETVGKNDGGISKCKILQASATAHPAEKIWIVDNLYAAGGHQKFYVTPGMSGIIIATGDVVVQTPNTQPFKGLIITSGTIYFDAGCGVRADEGLVYDLIKENAEIMLKLFKKAYLFIDTAPEGDVQPDQYLTYDNWKKNEE